MNSRILWEDEKILVCAKPAGLAVQSAGVGQMDMESELKNYLSNQQNRAPYLGIIHRLDQPVEGVLVFAKDAKSAAALNQQLTDGQMKKKYYAVVCGKLPEEQKKLEDYLLKDSKSGKAQIVSPKVSGAKRAALCYARCAFDDAECISLAEIMIGTGRFHQIRAQMANAGFPLLGDRKYGTFAAQEQANKLHVKNVALCAYHLEFAHPVTKEVLKFRILPQNNAFMSFKQILEKTNS